MELKTKSFQREAQKTLMLYACGPVLVFLLLGAVFVAASWQHYVVQRSSDVRMAAAGRMESWIAGYEAATDLPEGTNIARLRQDASSRAALSAQLYHAANTSRSGALFFLLDDERQIVLGTWKYLPAPIGEAPENMGLLARLQQSDGAPVTEWVEGVSASELDLAIGRSLPGGMVFFLLPGKFLVQELFSPYLDIIVTDRYDNVVLATGGRCLERGETAPRKLSLTLKSADRTIAEHGGQHYYVTQATLSTGWRVTTVLPVTDLLTRYAISIGSFVLVLLLFLPILWQSARREGDARSRAVQEEAARATAIADIRRLESQFQPHFLFNTLENIKYMIKLEPDKAAQMVMALSRLLRYSIHGQKRLVSFAEDLSYTHGFLEIQKARFGRRFTYEEEIPEEALDCAVPRLILQPIIENAIKYGEAADGTIHVTAKARRRHSLSEDALVLTVRDDGRGMEPEESERLRALLARTEDPANHTGLYNVHRRLQLLFGASYGVSFESKLGQGTTVILALPWNSQTSAPLIEGGRAAKRRGE